MTALPEGARGPVGPAERTFAIVALVLFSEGFFGLLLGHETGGEVPQLRYLWLPVYFLTLLYSLAQRRQVTQIAVANWPLLLVVGLCCLSALWSIDPGVTARRGIAVGATTLFGLYLAARFDDLDRLRLFGWCFGVLAFSSLFFALALPQYGITWEVHVGAWRGVFQQKNYLGQIMVFGAAVFLVTMLAHPSLRARAGAGFLLCVALVLLSTSMTSLIALLMLVSVAAAIALLFRYRALAVLIVYVSIIAGIALTLGLLIDPEAVFGLIGRDPSLTGRLDIWEPLWDMISRRIWLGYGYGAFWENPDGPAWYIRRILQWEVPSAHNGWVEVWLDIGLVGLGTFVLGFVAAVWRAATAVRIGSADLSLWPFLFLLLFVVFSLSESSILRQNNLVWVLYVATVAAFRYRPVAARPAPLRYGGMDRLASPPDRQWSAWR